MRNKIPGKGTETYVMGYFSKHITELRNKIPGKGTETLSLNIFLAVPSGQLRNKIPGKGTETQHSDTLDLLQFIIEK